MNLRRKRMILMRDVWYGYNRTASGNPVKLEAAKRLRQLTIYGNAVQDGTPTPDTPVDIRLCGDATGNLYDVNDKYKVWQDAESDDAGWIIVNADNSEGTSNKWPFFTTTYRDVVEPNTQYTVVTEIEYISGGQIFSDSKGSVEHMSPFNISFGYTTPGTHVRTVTSKSDLSDCTVLLRTIGFVEPGDTLTAKFRISLLKGSYTAETIPAYEPYGYKVSGRVEGDGEPPQEFTVYLPQQIAKVGDVADTVVLDMEKRTATLVQRTKEIVFDGTEIWYSNTNVSGNKAHFIYIDSIFANFVNFFSNRYIVEYANNDHCTYIANTIPVSLHIADNSFTTAAEFKAWLSELYASGEPLKYLFELATPVTTDITAMQDWDAMPQVKGTVTLTLSAEVPPSGAEAVYYSAERGD